MSTTYPTTKQSIPNPTSTDLLENADNTLDHDYQHGTVNDTIEALQDKVGIDGSATTSTHDYKLSAVTGSAKALTSGTSTQSVTGLTIVTPTLTLGSDTTGDMYYRNSGGVLTRLPIGTAGQIPQVSAGGIPEWVANPAAADASTTVKGVVEIATTAQISAGTGAGETGALLVVPASAVGAVGADKIVQFDGTGKYPAADGSAITNITAPASSMFVQLTKTTNATDGINDNFLYITTSSSASTAGYGSFFIPSNRTISSIQLLYGASNSAGQVQYWNFTFKSTDGAGTIETDSSTGNLLADASGTSELLATIPAASYNGLTTGRMWNIVADRDAFQGGDTASTGKMMGILINFS